MSNVASQSDAVVLELNRWDALASIVLPTGLATTIADAALAIAVSGHHIKVVLGIAAVLSALAGLFSGIALNCRSAADTPEWIALIKWSGGILALNILLLSLVAAAIGAGMAASY